MLDPDREWAGIEMENLRRREMMEAFALTSDRDAMWRMVCPTGKDNRHNALLL